MQRALLTFAALVLILGSVGCDYNYKPMDAKDASAHPLKPLPTDFRAQLWLKLAPTYSHTDLHFSRFDFYSPVGWEEGDLFDNHPVGNYEYGWRCDVSVTFVRPKHKDVQQRYAFVYKDGDFVAEPMTGELPKELMTPNSSIAYTPFDVAPNKVGALSAHLPDKSWSIDESAKDIQPTKGIRSFYYSKSGEATYDSAVYLVEKLTVLNGWKYDDDAKVPTLIAETPQYYVYVFKGPSAWPTFEKDALDSLFAPTPDDPGDHVGTRP